MRFNYTRLFFGAILVISAIGFAMAVSVDRSRIQSVPNAEIHSKWQWDYNQAEERAKHDAEFMNRLLQVQREIAVIRKELAKR